MDERIKRILEVITRQEANIITEDDIHVNLEWCRDCGEERVLGGPSIQHKPDCVYVEAQILLTEAAIENKRILKARQKGSIH